jgi:OOP family OmpA-OmpF porin
VGLFGFNFAIASIATPSHAADSSDNGSCDAAARRMADTVILPAWCTVALEHNDRKARLERLARLKGMAVPPRFYEYVVVKRDLAGLLPNFPADVPVLRVEFDERVFFDFDRSVIRPEATQILDLIAASLQKEPPDVALFVAGHTDAIGTEAYNTTLGMRRADAVSHALLDRGVGLSSVFRVSFGKAMPVDTNNTDEGRRHNRRVEFLFAAKPEAAAVWLARQAAETCFQGDASALERCRNAISVAEEVRLTSPPLLAPGAVADSPKPGSKRVAAVVHNTQAIETPSPNRQTSIAAPRTYTIDLGRKTVVIGLPSR